MRVLLPLLHVLCVPALVSARPTHLRDLDHELSTLEAALDRFDELERDQGSCLEVCQRETQLVRTDVPPPAHVQ